MYRTALSADEGMLFVYPFEDWRGFRMRQRSLLTASADKDSPPPLVLPR
jgi:hypothetical protein